MRRTTSLLVCILFAFGLSGMTGCFVTTRDRHRHGYVRDGGGGRCHPSQYWDGRTCRHKGRGHGARKHDGR